MVTRGVSSLGTAGPTGASGDLSGDAAPLLFREPAPDPVALAVLECPGEALLADRAGAAERERRARLFLGDGEEHVRVDAVARRPFLPDIRGGGVGGEQADVDAGEPIDPHRSFLLPACPSRPGPKE